MAIIRLFHAFLFAVLLGTLGVISATFAQDEIGLYFDTAGSVNCLTDSVTFPQSVDVFLVLKNCSSPDGIAGWEGALTLSEGCFLTAADLGPQALNVATPPEYIVGLGTPILYAPEMVIARFTLFFTGPGEIYLHAPEINSIEGELGPVYVTPGDSGRLTAMRYSFGSPVHPVLAIGDLPCPEYIAPQQPSDFGDPRWTEIAVGELPAGTVFSGCGVRQDASKLVFPEDIDWDALHRKSDVGIRGTLDSIDFRCFDKDGFPAGAAELSIIVSETFWGPEVDVLRVWVEGVDIPGCVSYSGRNEFPEIQDFSPGVELVIFSWYTDETLWTNQSFVFTNSDKSSQIFKDSTFSMIRKIGNDKSLKTQLSSADLVVLLDSEQDAEGRYPVRVVYTNRKSLADKAIVVADPQLDRLIRKFDGDFTGVLCALRDSGGKLMLQSGRRSVLFLTREGIVNNRGLLVDIDELWDTTNLK